MVVGLALISLGLTLVIVLVVAYHLIGVYLALRKGRGHLAELVGGLDQVRNDTAPLNGKISAINARLSRLAGPLLGANANLARVVQIAKGA